MESSFESSPVTLQHPGCRLAVAARHHPPRQKTGWACRRRRRNASAQPKRRAARGRLARDGDGRVPQWQAHHKRQMQVPVVRRRRRKKRRGKRRSCPAHQVKGKKWRWSLGRAAAARTSRSSRSSSRSGNDRPHTQFLPHQTKRASYCTPACLPSSTTTTFLSLPHHLHLSHTPLNADVDIASPPALVTTAAAAAASPLSPSTAAPRLPLPSQRCFGAY